MAISKERLEELIEQEATVYYKEYGKFKDVTLNNSYYIDKFSEVSNIDALYRGCCDFDDDEFRIIVTFLSELYENKEDAEFVAKYHTKRPEYFEPPVKLERGESYLFVSKKYGNAEIWHNFNNDSEYMVTDERYDCGGGEYFIFYTYKEAVEYARKLFLGCNDEN